MKTLVSATLSAYLNNLCESGTGGAYAVIDLYTIVLGNGTTLRWASWPVPISFPVTGIYASGVSVGGNTRVSGQTFQSTQGFVDRSTLTQSVGLEVAQIKMTIRSDPTMVIGSTPVLAAVAAGMFGGATGGNRQFEQ